ncbi:alpha/beta fold hydrolase [Saprospiraceae bacterium]|nr:alpha/beta fold hydrolase [Saprospiraceae bacterium]
MSNKLNYKEYGEGEPVIILHGFLGMLDNWHSFARKLSESYKVFTVDQRNHGKSFHSEEFDYAALSSDLLKLIDHLEITQCKLIGHSMGGKTVMHFLKDNADYVEKAVIVDIAPKQYDGGHEGILEALSSLDLNSVEKRSDAQDYLMEKIGNVGVVQFLLKNLNRNSDNTYSWKANIEVLHKKYSEVSQSVDYNPPCEVPSLFIKGSKSNYILDSDHSDINKKFKHAKIVEIQGAGHWVHAEKPVELLDEVTKFFE